MDQDGFALSEDCDDEDASVSPNGVEVAYDGIDQDCDGHDSMTSTETGTRARTTAMDAPAVFGDALWYSSTPGAALGSRVEPYADVDGDGTVDVLVPAVAATRSFPNSGAVYLLSSADADDVDDGALRVIDASGTDWYLGVAVDARDIDGDALPEVLGRLADNSGARDGRA